MPVLHTSNSSLFIFHQHHRIRRLGSQPLSCTDPRRGPSPVLALVEGDCVVRGGRLFEGCVPDYALEIQRSVVLNGIWKVQTEQNSERGGISHED
jgi:hypothetical protein